jgi:hypothetical protein
METIDAIKIIMSHINFDTNEFYMPQDFFDKAKLQSAMNHIQENNQRIKLFEDAMMEKRKDIFKSISIFGGEDETARES